MKRLIVGGAGQGKAAYAKKKYNLPDHQVWDCSLHDSQWERRALIHLHLLVRRMLEQGADPSREILSGLAEKSDWIVTCDEVGCGIVPTDAFSRQWREEVGRLCCALAREADVVEQVTCGISLGIKGREEE